MWSKALNLKGRSPEWKIPFSLCGVGFVTPSLPVFIGLLLALCGSYVVSRQR